MSHNELSSLPRALFDYFRSNTGRTVSRDELYEKVWKLKLHPKSRVVDQTVATLRKKLTPRQRIETVSEFGYRYEESA